MIFTRSWRLLLTTLAAGAVMFPAAAANAANGPMWTPAPVPQPFSAFECYQRCASPALVRTSTPRLAVNLPGPAYAQVLAEFEIRTAPGDHRRVVASGQTSSFMAPAVVTWQVPEGALTGGETYYWRSRALAERSEPSDWTVWQRLSIDTEAPEMPTVESEEYPEKVWGAVLGTEGRFDFSTASSDVVEFRWSLNGGSVTTTPATGTGPVTASVTFTPPKDMVNVLIVEAVDPAGWRSTPRNYQFWVTPPPVRFSHWSLDEQDGTTAADSGTIAAEGTLSGEVAFGPGYVGGSNGAVFTGSGGQITTTGPVLDTTQSFTVMAWVNLADPTLGDQTVLSQNGTTQASGFQLHFKQDANAGVGGWCLTLRTTDSAGAAQTVCADGAIAGLPTAGQWVHIAGRHDAITGEMAIYVMGGENCLGESARSTLTSTWRADGSFMIGQSMDGQRWRGGVDDVYAHQRALSESSICQQALQ